MKNIKKYFIPVWRVTVLTVAISLFIISLYSIAPKSQSVVLGRGLVPIEVTQLHQLTYK